VKGKVFLTFALVVILALTLTASAFARGGSPAKTYRANLITLNGSGVTGQVSIQLLPLEQMKVMVWAYGLAPRKAHMQALLGFKNGSQSVVPPPAADTSGDGYISFAEALPFTGPVLLDLTRASDVFPAAKKSGMLVFTWVYRGKDVLKDLDLGGVPLTKRVFMIQGGFRAPAYGPAVYDPTLPVAAARLVKS
jgi:hypothetical protein